MRRTITVIEGETSSMIVTVYAARAGASITILEYTDRVEKEIPSIGNGKYSMTNLYQLKECYRSRNGQSPFQTIEKYPMIDTLELFEGLRILAKNKNGYIYPSSGRASSVLDVLRMEMGQLGVRAVCGCQASEIRVGNGHGFVVKMSCGAFDRKRLILIIDSKAAPETGSGGSGYELTGNLGHTVITPLSALIQLRYQEKHCKQLAGIRTEARLTLYVSEKEMDAQTGEPQLTDYGISGTSTFQLSRCTAIALCEALFGEQRVTVRTDFLPQQTMKETKTCPESRKRGMRGKTAGERVAGLLNKKLSGVLSKLADIFLGERMADIDNRRWSVLLRRIKEHETVVATSNPYENTQICRDDVGTREVWPDTLEPRLVPGLYLVGELLDVDGICGGYNLQQMQFSSVLAGMGAARGRRRYGKGPETTLHRPQRQGKGRERHRKNRE